MAETVVEPRERVEPARRIIRPVHAVLLAGSLPLFLGTLLSDWAYWSTYEVQWINFAAWLVSGASLLAGLALLWALIDFFRADRRRDRASFLYLSVLIGTFLLGFVNALVHGKDAWATMPAGLILSVFAFLAALVAVWLGYSTLRRGAVR